MLILHACSYLYVNHIIVSFLQKNFIVSIKTNYLKPYISKSNKTAKSASNSPSMAQSKWVLLSSNTGILGIIPAAKIEWVFVRVYSAGSQIA